MVLQSPAPKRAVRKNSKGIESRQYKGADTGDRQSKAKFGKVMFPK